MHVATIAPIAGKNVSNLRGVSVDQQSSYLYVDSDPGVVCVEYGAVGMLGAYKCIAATGHYFGVVC